MVGGRAGVHRVIGAGGHGWGLAVFPLLAAVTAVAFAAILIRRVASRWRSHEAVWAVALLIYAAASAAMFSGVAGGWDPGEFRLYWLFGAVLNVPFLFAGEVYLLARQRRWVGHAVLAAIALLSAFATWEMARAAIRLETLEESLPLGREVFGAGSLPHRLAQYASWPAYVLLLIGLVGSAVRMKDTPGLRDQTTGVFGIALGATMVAIGSGIGAAFHVVPLFSVALAAGVAVMFWGFLRTSRPDGRRSEVKAGQAEALGRRA